MKNKILNLFLAISMILSMAVMLNVAAAETEVTGGSSIESATALDLDTAYLSALEDAVKDQKLADVDWYKFTTKENNAYYRFEFGNNTGDGKYFVLCTYSEKELYKEDIYGNKSYIEYILLEPGETYYIKVYHTDTYDGIGGKYSINVAYCPDDYKNDIAGAESISVNDTIQSTTECEDDLDYFTFNDAEDKMYTFEITTKSGRSQCLRVLDSNGKELEESSLAGAGESRTVEVELQSGETYYVEISCYHDWLTDNEGGEYVLSIYATGCKHQRTSKNNYVTEYEEIVGDENNHYVIKYYDKVCDECGEITEARIQDSKRSERHNFDGNYCSGCEFEKEEPEYIPDDDEEEYVYIPEDDDSEPIDGETSFGSEVSEWAEEEMEQAYDEGLIPDVLVGENLTETIDRAEFAAIAVKLYETISNESTSATSYCPFDDISGNSCYTEIIKAYNLGITAGTTDTTFDPNAMITREQLATMLCRAIKKCSYPDWTLETDSEYKFPTGNNVPRFADDADISDYAKPSVYYMASIGAIKGVDSTHFAPKNTTAYHEAIGYAMATREQAIAISLRILNY